MTDEQFNPDDHTVDEVNEHLADEAEVERVLEAERAGKNRTTVNGNAALPEGDDDEGTYDEYVEREGTTDAFIIPSHNTVPQSVQDEDAADRNAELEDAGVNSAQGFIGSDGAANLLG